MLGRHGEEVDKIMSGRIKCHKETHTKKSRDRKVIGKKRQGWLGLCEKDLRVAA
jgi:hypothetical protein